MSAYESRRAPALAWGYWLRVMADEHPRPLKDEDGTRWSSVREYFWERRLGFPRMRDDLRDEQFELMLSVLTAAEHRQLPGAATAFDMFENSRVSWQSYRCWLISVGLFEDDGNPRSTLISAEGHAVLLMLVATRPAVLDGIGVSPAAYRILRALDGVVGPPESRIAAAEAASRLEPQAFVREEVSREPAISLVMRDGGGLVAFSRTVWSLGFADEDDRDRFFLWLVERVDRWDAWTGIAHKRGGVALTQHLFAMLVAEGGLS